METIEEEIMTKQSLLRIPEELLLTIAVSLCFFCSTGGAAIAGNTPTPLTSKDSTYQVMLSIEGPWAYAVDKANNRLVLIAPDDKTGHYPPTTSTSDDDTDPHLKNDSQLTINSYVAPGSSTCEQLDISTYPANISDKTFLAVTKAGGKGRYVLSLPIPDSCASLKRFSSKVSTTWWTDQNHHVSDVKGGPFSTIIQLTYTVASLSGFTLDGQTYGFTTNNGIPSIAITMSPNNQNAIWPGTCDIGSRRAFKLLIDVFRSKDSSFALFEDFPQADHTTYDKWCWDYDPQNPNGSPNAFKKLMDNLSKRVQRLRAFIEHPGASKLKQADVQYLKAAALHTPAHGNVSAEAFFKDLAIFVDSQSDSNLSRKRHFLLAELDDFVHMTSDGAGACRKAVVHLTITASH